MSIDFKKFKKINCDDKCTYLEHPNGHQIKIAHKGLSPSMQKQLDELPLHKAKGGPLGGPFSAASSEGHTRNSKPSQPSKPLPQAAYKSPKMAKNAFTEPDNSGTEGPFAASQSQPHSRQHEEPHPDIVLKALSREAPPFGPMGPIGTLPEEQHHYPPCINPSCKSFGKSHPNCRCYGGKFAEGGQVGSYCSENRAHQQGCEYFRAGGMVGEDPSEMVDEVPVGAPPMPTPAAVPEATPNPNAPPSAEPMPEAEPVPNPAVSQDTSEPARQPAEAPAMPEPAPMPMTPVQHFQAKKQEHLADIMQESKAFESDVNSGHIQPHTYADLFANKSTLGKIGTIFGLLVGGAGSGLAHQPNMLMEMMKKELDNDFNQQQQNVTNKQNFIKLNQQALMNRANIKNLDADTAIKSNALARMNYNITTLHSLVSMVNKYPPGSPQRQDAENALAFLHQGVNNENFNIGDRAATALAASHVMNNQNSGQGNGSEQQFQNQNALMKTGLLGPMGEKAANDRESKHIPGIPGQSSRPLGGDDQARIRTGMEFQKQLSAFRDWTAKHSGDLSPSDKRYGEALAGALQNAYRGAINGGVYKEGEQNFISKFIDSEPTKFFNNIRVLPKLDAVAATHRMKMDQDLKSLGFAGYPGGQSHGQQQSAASQTAMKNGVQYKKVNGGWMPVK